MHSLEDKLALQTNFNVILAAIQQTNQKLSITFGLRNLFRHNYRSVWRLGCENRPTTRSQGKQTGFQKNQFVNISETNV